MPKSQKSNNVVYHDELEQGSEEWLERRIGNFTGSNAYKLLGSFDASHALAKNDSFTGNSATRRGHRLEPEAIALYEEITETEVSHAGFVTNTKFPNCLYSPDGYTDDRVIEVKCFSLKYHLETIARPAVKILAQCHFGQMILEKKLTDLVLYCPDKRLPPEQMLVIIPIKRDKLIQDNFKRKIAEYNGRQSKI